MLNIRMVWLCLCYINVFARIFPGWKGFAGRTLQRLGWKTFLHWASWVHEFRSSFSNGTLHKCLTHVLLKSLDNSFNPECNKYLLFSTLTLFLFWMVAGVAGIECREDWASNVGGYQPGWFTSRNNTWWLFYSSGTKYYSWIGLCWICGAWN